MGNRVVRCRSCQAPVVFFRSPFTRNVRTFDPDPVDGTHVLAGVRAFPVTGVKAHRPAHLAEQIQVQRHCTDEQAMDEVRDMPWHLLHECPPDPTHDPAPSTTTVKEINPS